MFIKNSISLTLVLVLAAVGAMAGCQSRKSDLTVAEPKQASDRPATDQGNIYDTEANADKDIAAALANARRDNQRVLIMYGGDWCSWCHKLHNLFTTNKDIAKVLLYEYQMVMVDLGRFDKHMHIAKRYGANLKENGVPFLTILSADGEVLANQETGSLEKGGEHDPEKVHAFLTKYQTKKLDAPTLMKLSMIRAKAEDKLVMLHLGAPWCPWCHKLDDFLAREDIAPLIGKDFIDRKVDVDRMERADEVVARFRSDDKGGIPWMAVVDVDGKVVATSDAPTGNFGFPVADEEIVFFVDLLKTHGDDLTDEDLTIIGNALKAEAEKIKNRS